MPVTLWRIATDAATYQAHDMSGTGAERTGGRWNRDGTPLVYAATSRALVCLETVVHIATGDALPLNRYLVEITVPDHVWVARTALDPANHVGWDAEPAGQVSLEWGTNWAAAATAAIAEVPSVIVPEEHNCLINPRHPDAAAITARKVRKWMYDQRLWHWPAPPSRRRR